jgi:hypothetical protein
LGQKREKPSPVDEEIEHDVLLSCLLCPPQRGTGPKTAKNKPFSGIRYMEGQP